MVTGKGPASRDSGLAHTVARAQDEASHAHAGATRMAATSRAGGVDPGNKVGGLGLLVGEGRAVRVALQDRGRKGRTDRVG